MNKQVRIFSEDESLLPKYAHPTDSGMDAKSVSRLFVFNTTLRKKIEVKDGELEDFINKCRESEVEIILSGFVIYDSGVKMILPDHTDCKGMAKSGIYKNAPALSVANGVGLIDEPYRNTTKMIFRIEFGYLNLFNAAIAKHVDEDKTYANLAINSLLRDIYEVGVPMSQLVIENREEVELIKLDKWYPEYDHTERGTNGLGSGDTLK